ncbi:hypothetical protein D9758_010040 [Tetrapyrgos nigripes]|uniref:Uncharacterized protein n=1 Tax=Tetrapyrgos nigripes TaxID=182062 RepID=A0A8H5CUF1_9AGAR|nr:hypothetical protein D9758_010040 [Tetrapyrgos nigripes]
MLKLLSVLKFRIHNSLGRATRRGLSAKSRTGRPLKRVLISMKPNELTSFDYMDISGQRCIGINYRNAPCRKIRWEVSKTSERPFPERTHGFFYYHLPKNAPLFAGGVRFRVCPSDDTRTFQDGDDLLKLSGLPWEISNWAFALHKTYRPWGEEMVETGVIRPGALELCRKLTSQVHLHHPSDNPVIYSLKQPFSMPLGLNKIIFWIANEKNMVRVLLRSRILEPFNVTLKMPVAATADVCFDRVEGNIVVRLLSVPPEYAGKMKYKVGDTIPYRPTRPEVLDMLKNFPRPAGHE